MRGIKGTITEYQGRATGGVKVGTTWHPPIRERGEAVPTTAEKITRDILT